ncbi:MAG: helix-turn-helix domain-containing protein [Burkholderiales bacterium]|nr:helix-turn-helix domain-containing protein [Burkholderiales bacterium]
MSDTRPVSVAVLTVPEVTASVVYGMHDLFLSAGRDWPCVVEGMPGTQRMQPVIVARHAGPLAVANGVVIHAAAPFASHPHPDVVCVPELFLPPVEPLAGRFVEEVDWLRRCHANGAVIATACSGALLLAESGLLDGEEATTHWAYCDAMTRRYPKVTVRTQRALVIAGPEHRLVMAGGGTTWLDLALYLIARTVGVEEAKHLLETGEQPVEAVAREAGYEDPGFFSRLFRRKVGLSPAQYRRRFGAMRKALDPGRG